MMKGQVSVFMLLFQSIEIHFLSRNRNTFTQLTYIIHHLLNINQNFVFIKLEDDIWEPPGSLALHTIAIARRATCLRERVEGLLDDIGYTDTRGKRESAT